MAQRVKPRITQENRAPFFFFVVLLLLLLVIGLSSMFSASYVYALYNNDNSYYFIIRQAIFAAIGLGAAVVLALIDYRVWFRLSYVLYALAILLLVIALVAPSLNGVHRWIAIGSITFQPSDLAKFAIIVFLAMDIDRNHDQMSQNPERGFIKFFTTGSSKLFFKELLFLGAVCGLVFFEPHLSGTVLIGLIGMAMLFVGGTRFRYLLGLAALGAFAVFLAIGVLHYEADRIAVWQDPLGIFNSGSAGRDMAWQTVQSLYAIGSGGLFGLGPGASRQKHLFLPEPQNDFIFAIICEEWGFIGATVIILLFAALVICGIVIAVKAKDKFGSMLAVGISAQVGIQVLLNIAVVTNSFPNTGIGLPFFSYGGTSMLMLLGEMGVLLSVCLHSTTPQPIENE